MPLYKKVFTRSMRLALAECWDAGERVNLEKICDGIFLQEALFLYRPNVGVLACYNWSDPRQDPAVLYAYISQHPEVWETQRTEYLACCDAIDRVDRDGGKGALQELVGILQRFWPGLSLSVLLALAPDSSLPDSIRTEALRTRQQTGEAFFRAEELLKRLVRHCLPEGRKDDAPMVLTSEVLGELPSAEEVDRRRKGYLFVRGSVLSGDAIGEFLSAHDIDLVEDIFLPDQKLRGQSASTGVVRGVVRVVYFSEQMSKVLDGDILVSPMTTPNLLPAMHRAAAFVTDEGGVTCHAAIVAREMNKPCVIGTRIATKLLQDGDVVEVDATKGVVTILSRA